MKKLFDKKLIKLKKFEKSKHSCITLFDKTEKLAKQEGKIPVVALCQKHRKGFWIIVKEEDLDKVINEQRNNTRTTSRKPPEHT